MSCKVAMFFRDLKPAREQITVKILDTVQATSQIVDYSSAVQLEHCKKRREQWFVVMKFIGEKVG